MIKTAERQYVEAFEDEIQAFRARVKARARQKVEAAMKEAEEEERQKRLGPGGLDPLEVIETLPPGLKECFETKNVARLQGVLADMSKEDASYHMQRCIDAGLWVPDAKAAGLTPASEELKKMNAEADEESDSDAEYEAVDEEEEGGEGETRGKEEVTDMPLD